MTGYSTPRPRSNHRKNYRNAASNKSIITRKPTASTQKQQILALNKKVNKVASVQRQTIYQIMHSASMAESSLLAPYATHNLINIPTWAPIFGETDTTENAGKYFSRGCTIDLSVRTDNEEDSTPWTFFVITPKTEKVREEAYSAAGALNNLVAGVDYVQVEAKALMNLKRWNVHKCLRGVTTPVVTKADSALPGTGQNYINEIRPYRKTFRLYMKNFKVINRTGKWDVVVPDELAHNMLYTIVVFNNNLSSLEGSPKFSMTVLHKGQTSQ